MPLDGSIIDAVQRGVSVTHGLLGYWPLDLWSLNWGANLAYDRAGANHGTLNNINSTNLAAGFGYIRQGLNFVPGSTTYIATGLVRDTTSPITITFWTNTPGGTTGAGFCFPHATARLQAHVPYSDNVIYWDYDNFTGGRLTTSFSSYLNKPTLIGLSNDGAAAKAIVLNGRLAASNTTGNGGGGSGFSGLEIGRGTSGGTFYHNGPMWDFRVYGRVLDLSEHLSLYEAGRQGRA